jgi:hypothetical protein
MLTGIVLNWSFLASQHNWTFHPLISLLNLFSFWTLTILLISKYQEKSQISTHFKSWESKRDYCLHVLYACKMSSPTDKRNLNEIFFTPDFGIFCVCFFRIFNNHWIFSHTKKQYRKDPIKVKYSIWNKHNPSIIH